MATTWDQDVYVPLSDYGRLGLALNETSPESWNREQLLKDLDEGQLERVIAVFAFNVEEGWARDVSEDVARELLKRWHDKGSFPASWDIVPPFVEPFITEEDVLA